jgi:hypothetical protein
MTITHIEWETFGSDVSLPTTLDIPLVDFDPDKVVAELLRTGWFVKSYYHNGQRFRGRMNPRFVKEHARRMGYRIQRLNDGSYDILNDGRFDIVDDESSVVNDKELKSLAAVERWLQADEWSAFVMSSEERMRKFSFSLLETPTIH